MRILGVGDNVVDRYPQLGLMFPGGQALNVAVAARRAGAEAGYLGALGTDAAGRHVLAALRAEGVDVERLRIVPGANAYGVVELDDGDRVFVGSSLGVSRFHLTIEDLAYAATFDIAHSSESSGLELDIPDLAKHVPVSFDFATNRDPAYSRELLPYVTVACFSASDLDDEETETFLRHVVEQGPKVALATRGAADAVLVEGHRVLRQPALPARVVDTLGAGDAFTGRFLVGFINDEDRTATLQQAAEAAAHTCESYGAFGYGTANVPAGEEEARETRTPTRVQTDQHATVVERSSQ